MELRELLDKVSSFDKFVLPCGELTAQMRASAIKMRNAKNAKNAKNRDFCQKLRLKDQKVQLKSF